LPSHVDRGRGIIDTSLHVIKGLSLVFAVDEKSYDAPLVDLFSCVLVFVLGQGTPGDQCGGLETMCE